MFRIDRPQLRKGKRKSLFIDGPFGFHLGVNGLVYLFHIEFGRFSGFMFEREGI